MQGKEVIIPTAQEVKQSWNVFASQYSQMIETPNLQLGLALSRMLKVQSAQNILEIGCGSGRLTLNNLAILPPGTKYTSVDISDEMIKLAESSKEQLAKENRLNAVEHKFVVSNGEDISFIPDESVDVVIIPLCIHITPDANKFLQEAMRVLKKGGRIGWSVLGKPELCTFFRIFTDRLKEFKIEVPQRRSIFYLGTREASIKLAQDNGIQVDFCWNENVTMGVFDEKDVEAIANLPSNQKNFKGADEETQKKILEAMKADFAEKKKNFTPLNNDNILLIGRKPE